MNSFRPITREDVIGSHAEPITVTGVDPSVAGQVSVVDNGEALVHASSRLTRVNVYAQWNPGARWDAIREEVARRLDQAAELVPEPFSLVLLNAHRTRDFQASLLNHYFPEPAEAGSFVSDPTHTVLRAPHTTGGAVDVSLAIDGQVLELGTAFDDFSPAAALIACEADENSPQREGRRVLSAAMVRAGFAPYPSEWWHWSYGDQFWAATFHKPCAVYDTVP